MPVPVSALLSPAGTTASRVASGIPGRVADIFALITSYSLKVDRETTGGCPTSRAFRDVGIPTADTEERARTFDTVDERK
jgi:hypothetical protein